MDKDEVVKVLNDLIATSKDGEHGFRTCAEHTESSELRAAFMQRADACAQGAAELQAIVVNYGGAPEDSGSVSGALHRGWARVRETFSLNDDKAMLDECERGEDVALEHYGDALKRDLPSDVMEIVQRHFAGVKRNHDQIKAMRDRYGQMAV